MAACDRSRRRDPPRPPVPPRRTKRASSRLPRLLDEAARAFAQRGFAAASVREIVEPVGMLPGSLYCHFATKEALLAAVYKEGVERIGAAVDAAIAPLDDPWQRLEAACVAHLGVAARPDRLLAGRHPGPAERRAGRRSGADRPARLVREALRPPRRGAAAGAADRPAMLRLMLVGALNWSQTWYRAGRGATPEKIARRFVGLLKSSLAACAMNARNA